MRYYFAITKTAVEDFSRNKVRTLLTSLGIMVGVLSVLMLIAIGLGLRNYISQQFENLGANVIAVVPGSGPSGGFSTLISGTRFDERDIHTLERIGSIEYVAPAHISNASMRSDNKESIGTIIATSEDFALLFDLDLIAGEYFSEGDVSSSAKVGIIAENLANDLFDSPEDAVGKSIKTRDTRIKIVGAVKNVGNPERDNAIIMPYTTGYNLVNPDREFFALYSGVTNEDKVASTKKEIENDLIERYEKDQFEVIEPSEILGVLDQIFSALNAVLISIASISLVVGGIGIMNIMYANVTERTKEIGIRRAVGAKRSDILFQFLTESVLLTLIGGLLGVIISFILVFFIRPYFPLELNIISIMLAFGVSSLIGVIFGVFPARRAASLTPIEAIRDG